jgi:hypothetical protein
MYINMCSLYSIVRVRTFNLGKIRALARVSCSWLVVFEAGGLVRSAVVGEAAVVVVGVLETPHIFAASTAAVAYSACQDHSDQD